MAAQASVRAYRWFGCNKTRVASSFKSLLSDSNNQHVIWPAQCRSIKARKYSSRPSASCASDLQGPRKELDTTGRQVATYFDRYVFPEPPDLIMKGEHEHVISQVNRAMDDPGRLFAVVTLSGEQFKVTVHDIVCMSGILPGECGTKIRLEKVSLVGGRDFTLVGKPLLGRKVAKVEAMVIEKTPSVDVIIKKFIRRKRHERTYKFNSLHTVLRITNIEVFGNLN